MSKHSNLDIKDSACHHIVHNLQHPTSRPTTKSTQTAMVNALNKNISLLPGGIYIKSTEWSTKRYQQANSGKSGFEVERVQAFWVLRSLASNMNLAVDLWPETHTSNNPRFCLKHPGVPDGFDVSGATSYPVTENQTGPVAQATGRVAYLPCGGIYTMPLILAMHRIVYYARHSGISLLLLCIRNVVTYTHHQNDTYVTLFAGVAVMQ